MSNDLSAHYQHMYEECGRTYAARVVLVTPAQARRWLDRMGVNRPMGPVAVLRYKRYIEDRLFRCNGEPLIFTPDEVLINGQHRCQAIAEAGVAVPCLCVFGVPADCFSTFDSGRIRSAADTLSTMGRDRSATLASALAWLFRYQTYGMNTKAGRLSNTEIVELFADNPSMEQSVRFVWPMVKRGIHLPGPTSFLYHVCRHKRPDLADEFFNNVMTGANLSPKTAAIKLNTYCVSRKGKPTLPITLEYMGTWIKAWNAHTRGACPQSIRWSPAMEEFPEAAS